MKKFLLIVLNLACVLGISEAYSFFHSELIDVIEISEGENIENQEENTFFELPLLEISSIYRGNFGLKEFAVFVEESNADVLEGHYLSLEEEVSDTIAFRLHLESENLHFVSRDKDICLHLSELQTDFGQIEGYVQHSFLNSTHFSFSPYDVPQFVEYDSARYQRTMFEVQRIEKVRFANVDGYWTDFDEHKNSFGNMLLLLNLVLNVHDLELYMDVYLPKNDPLAKRPFVMLIHGGSFYYGSRKDLTVSSLCEHLASLGYVAASIDYRIGFRPTKKGIERTGYSAIQDAHAAMRFITSNQSAFGIDTSMMFVGGCSAGSITALGLAFMTNETRPMSTRKSLLYSELGDIETSGNSINAHFSLKGVVDMWGAMPSLEMLEGENIPVVAFHGDADDIVPYGYDYPFCKTNQIKKLLFNKMYGSSCIVAKEKELGVKSELYTFGGYKHAPQLTDNSLNDNYYFIQDKMCAFLDEIIQTEKPQIVKRNGWYQVDGEVCQYNWTAEGGLIIETKHGEAKVVWIGNAPKNELKVSGIQKYGIGFTQEIRINKTIGNGQENIKS